PGYNRAGSKQRGEHRVEQFHLTSPSTLRMPATEIVLSPVNQLQNLLIHQTCHSLNLRRPPRILVDPHKSREYRKVAVAQIIDTPLNRGLLNNAQIVVEPLIGSPIDHII